MMRRHIVLAGIFLILFISTMPLTRAAEVRDRLFAQEVVSDQYGVLAPWYQGQNGQFDYRVRIAAETFRRFPWVTPPKAASTAPEYAFNNRWEISPEGEISIPGLEYEVHGYKWWVNAGRGQASARAILAWSEYYRYSGDPAALAHMEVVADTLLDHSLTSDDHPWPRFLISVPVAGKPYDQADPKGWMQLDIAGEAGVALLRAYQITGKKRWLDAVKQWADVLVEKRDRSPGAAPWGRYANPENVTTWGDRRTGNIQTGGVVYLLEMFDELIRLGHTGKNKSYIEARDAAREYFKYTLLPDWYKDETWGRSYWDWEQDNQAQTVTDWAARYMLDNKDYFPNWKHDVRNISTIFLNRTSASPKSAAEVYNGAWASPESTGCCGSSLAWAPVEFALVLAQYGVEANDEWALELARRMQILGTYDVHDTGVVEDNIFGGGIAADGWTNGAVPSIMKWTLRTMSWMPEVLGAARENHIMRSTQVVDSVVYGDGRIEYSTYDAPENSTEVLRLAFKPSKITGNGRTLRQRTDLDSNGYTLKSLPVGDYIVTIRHDGLKEIVVEGEDPQDIADSESLHYSGDWQQVRSRQAHGGSLRTTSDAGAEVEFTFTGNQLRLLGSVGPDGGKADVYVDGEKQLVFIDFWNPRKLHNKTVYYRNGLSQGKHTVRIVARKDSNPLSKGRAVSVEGVAHSAEQGDNGYGSGGGTKTQRMIFGYTERQDYIDLDGNTWRPGTEFVVRTGNMIDPVAHTWWKMPQVLARYVMGTRESVLYQYGVRAPEFTVNLTVAPGTYHARLKFLEHQFSEANRRAMSIFVNGEKMVDRMDVWATGESLRKEEGDRPVAADLVFNGIKPQNGIIEIRFKGESVNGVDTKAMIQALEIGPGNGGKGAVPVAASAP